MSFAEGIALYPDAPVRVPTNRKTKLKIPNKHDDDSWGHEPWRCL